MMDEALLLQRHVRVPEARAKAVENYTAYIIDVNVSDCHWSIQRRYSEFYELHEKLLALKLVKKNLLPPKKLMWNQSKGFVEKRREQLEGYLQKVLGESAVLSTPLLHFLEFDIYDIYGVSQALATELFEKGDAILACDDVCEMTPMQLYAITERLKLSMPTCSRDDARSDIGHIMDFICRLKLMRIVGSRNKLGCSSRVVDKLAFDLSPFKHLQHLQIDVCNLSLIDGLATLKKTLSYLAVHHSIKAIKDILLPEGDHWATSQAAGPSSLLPSAVIPIWKQISRADFRYNNLNTIDTSIKLIPNVVRLDLSHNEITTIENLQDLFNMTHLDLSHNQLGTLDGVHARLGNITMLSLAANELSSLRGLGKLYSLVNLDVSNNRIAQVVEVNHISNLPCLESLDLRDNPITSIMDYRTKVLDLFQEQYTSMTLDGKPASQKEIDKVAILKAIQKAKDGKVEKLTRGKKNSPTSRKRGMPVHHAEIVDIGVTRTPPRVESNNSKTLGVPETSDFEASASSNEDSEFRAKVEELRREGGEAWLTILNEYRETPGGGPAARPRREPSPKRGGHSPKVKGKQDGRSPKLKRKDFQEGTKSGRRFQDPTPPPSPTIKISSKALLYCFFDELARHQSEGHHSIPELIFNLRIYFRGPVLCTYGPRHRSQSLPEPEPQGPSVVGYLEQMSPVSQREFVDLLRELNEGTMQLPTHICPSPDDAAELLRCISKVLGLEDEVCAAGEVTVADEIASAEEVAKATEETVVEAVANLRVARRQEPADDKIYETEVIAPPRCITPVPTVTVTDSPVIVRRSRSNSPRVIPTYDDATLENLTQRDPDQQRIIAQLTADDPRQAIAAMSASDLVRYFHESIAEIGAVPEKLTHVIWAGAVAFRQPTAEIAACVMLSDRAIYVLSSDASDPTTQLMSPPVDVNRHRRMKSDSGIKDHRRDTPIDAAAGFNGGRVLSTPHASGVLVTATENKRWVKCQHVLKLTDITEVVVGLFDQKLRLTGPTAMDTVALLTRNFQTTLGFLEWLMQVLPIRSAVSKSPDSSNQGGDPYKLHRAYTEDFLHPSSVKFCYPNDETINDLTYIIVAHLNNAKISINNTNILLYMLVYQVHCCPPSPSSPVTVKEPLEEHCRRSHRTLVVTTHHLTLCREDHVSYPLPGFMKSPPDSPQYEVLEVQATANLRRLVVSDFASRDVTLVFEVMDVVVDITMDHYGERAQDVATPEVAWTLVLPSFDDRERLRKQLCHTWQEVHGKELSIQVNT